MGEILKHGQQTSDSSMIEHITHIAMFVTNIRSARYQGFCVYVLIERFDEANGHRVNAKPVIYSDFHLME